MSGTSTAPSAGDASYLRSLKQIKELEEKVQVEIDSHKKQVEQQMANLDEQLKESIAKAKADGEKVLEAAIEEARQKARKEADRIMADAHEKAKNLRLNQQAAKQVIDILLSGIQ